MTTTAVWKAQAVACCWALLLALALSGVQGKKGFGDGGQEYGYVDVRSEAHMFYWLYYVNGGEVPDNKPLVIWLQGGPGASSTSYGNFMELGPLDADLNKRSTSWVNHVNLLFIDNPVGSGYSYVDHYSALTSNNQQIAQDLVAFTKQFMITYPQFQKIPLYIFCESYGGKMTAEFALNLYKEQKAGTVLSNLKGIALGDSWISPIDSVLTWAPYLLQTGMVDTNGYNAIMDSALEVKKSVDRGQWSDATDQWGSTESVVMSESSVDFYNILTREGYFGTRDSAGRGTSRSHTRTTLPPREVLFRNHVLRTSDDDLNTLMDTKVKPALGVIPENVKHQTSSRAVFDALASDFMKPVTDVVELLLNTTDIKVAVISGQLDLIVDTPGTVAWVERLHWKQGDYWLNQAIREPLGVDGVVEGFKKSAGNFAFYWINRAGHMVPADNPAAAIEVLQTLTELKKKN